MTTSGHRQIDTGTDHLLADVGGSAPGVGRIVLNRPDRRNALSAEMLDALGATLALFDADPEVRAILLTGAGGAFCAGGDVKAFAAAGGALAPHDDRVARQRAVHRETVLRLRGLDVPTVAALPGAAAGAGLGLALACDLRVGCPDTVLTTAYARVALSGDYGTAWSLTRLLGPARARRLLLVGERLDADTALEWGLLDRVHPTGEIAEGAADLAGRLAAGSRATWAAMKQNLIDAETLGFADAVDRELPRHESCRGGADHREALAALGEKREPVFER